MKKIIMCPAKENIKEFFQRQGYSLFYCGGNGICGKCKVQVLEGNAGKLSKQEEDMLTAEEKGKNIRLLCQIRAISDLKLYIIEENNQKIEIQRAHKITVYNEKRKLEEEKVFGAAFDIGTTTVVGKLFDLNEKYPLAEMTTWNPQSCFGADVITRMQYCLEHTDGIEYMQKLIIDCINEMLLYFKEKAKTEISFLVTAGNSVMTHFLLKQGIDTLAKAPFQPAFIEEQERDAKTYGFYVKDKAKLLTLPLLQGQVGGDITAALLSIDIFSQKSGTILADIGTNGEIAFFWNNKIYICSTAAGPALEGAGISCGMRAQPGAIENIWLMGGEIYTKVIGNLPAKGICGSAFIDAIAVLLDLGKIHNNGYLEDGSLQKEKIIQGKKVGNIRITQEDIRQYQMVKGAIRAGMETLVLAANAKLEEIEQIYIAGSFGSKIRKQNAVKTGLLPEIPLEKITMIGNASLKGASMVLLSKEARQYAKKIQESIVLVNLANKKEFQERYLKQMNF